MAEHRYDHHLAALHSPERRIANVRKLEQLARGEEERVGPEHAPELVVALLERRRREPVPHRDEACVRR